MAGVETSCPSLVCSFKAQGLQCRNIKEEIKMLSLAQIVLNQCFCSVVVGGNQREELMCCVPFF